MVRPSLKRFYVTNKYGLSIINKTFGSLQSQMWAWFSAQFKLPVSNFMFVWPAQWINWAFIFVM